MCVSGWPEAELPHLGQVAQGARVGDQHVRAPRLQRLRQLVVVHILRHHRQRGIVGQQRPEAQREQVVEARDGDGDGWRWGMGRCGPVGPPLASSAPQPAKGERGLTC